MTGTSCKACGVGKLPLPDDVNPELHPELCFPCYQASLRVRRHHDDEPAHAAGEKEPNDAPK